MQIPGLQLSHAGITVYGRGPGIFFIFQISTPGIFVKQESLRTVEVWFEPGSDPLH